LTEKQFAINTTGYHRRRDRVFVIRAIDPHVKLKGKITTNIKDWTL
jgi:hypothetical protein